MADEDLLELIAPAVALPHGARTLRDHLIGTWEILRGWGAPAEVARAGLIHSVYSTQYYAHRLFSDSDDDRAGVRARAGAAAEQLAYTFCRVDREALWDRFRGPGIVAFEPVALRVGEQTEVLGATKVASLLLLEMANYAEQAGSAEGAPTAWMFWVLGWRGLSATATGVPMPPVFSLELGRLDGVDEEAACEAYGVEGGAERAVELNPYAAEPRLRVAMEEAGRGRRDVAAEHAGVALVLLDAWQTAWDKRRSFREWRAMASELAQGR